MVFTRLKHTVWRSTALVATLAAFASAASAQDALSIKLGEADFFPSVRLTYLTNSNAFLTPDNETATTALVVAPRFELVAERRLLRISGVYEGGYATYSEDNLNYDDHRLELSAQAELSARQRLTGFAILEKNHEVLGTGLTRSIADDNTEQVEKAEFSVGGSLIYGAQAARGNVELGLVLSGQNFLNQDVLTAGRSFTRVAPFGQFSYRLSSTARALVELGLGIYSYDDAARDYNDVTVSAGIILADGRKTSGTAKIGFTQASFDDASREDQSTLTADVSLTYLPVRYSQLDFSLQRSFETFEGASTGSNILEIEDVARLDWEHQWSSRFRTNAFLVRNGRALDCPDRDTETVAVGVNFGVAIRRWLIIGAGIRTTERSAVSCPGLTPDEVNLDFKRQQISANVRVTL